MAPSLFDLKRLQITAETRAWLQAEATQSGRSQQEVVREVLHEIALGKIQAAKVLVALSTRDGQLMDTGGRKR